MKATQTPWIILTGFALSGTAWAEGPRAGGVEAYVNTVEGDTFSANTRVKGEILFNLSNTLGTSEDGEGHLLDSVLRYSGAGEQGPFRIHAGVGNNPNVFGLSDGLGAFESYYTEGGLTYRGAVDNGAFQLHYGLGAGVTHYNKDLPAGLLADTNTLFDFDGVVGFTYRINNSWRIDNYSRFALGAHGSTNRGYVTTGVQADETLDWLSDTKLHGRFDGQDLGQRGIGLTTSITGGGYGPDGSNVLDSWRVRGTQEVRYNFDEDTTVFIEGAYGMREWTGALSVVDSTHYRGGLGFRGERAGLSGEIKAGYHLQDYDNAPIATQDTDVIYVEGHVGNQNEDGDMGWRAYFLHGIQEIHPGIGAPGMVDPEGFRAGLRTTYVYNETLTFGSDLAWSDFSTNDVVSQGTPRIDMERISFGLSADFWVHDQLMIGVGTTWSSVDDAGGSSDAISGVLRTTFSF